VLLALWPGVDGRQGMTALQATIEQLNGLLLPALRASEATIPPVWLDSRDGTCRLDLNRVESDVHRFIRLCRAASLMPAEQALDNWSRVRDLYRGDLLDGPGARSYAWVDSPAEDGDLSLRDALREQYYRATLLQARLLARADRNADAIPLFQTLLDVEPLLEDVARDLFRCHAAVGDLDGLVAEEQRLRLALREAAGPDDDPDPEPATVALFARLREDLEARASVIA
jgi:two-component SAPR family response regulator